MAGFVHIPWYATVWRGDRLADALGQIAPLALRHGATEYAVHRNRDDPYSMIQMAAFESKLDWQRYWNGADFVAWRTEYSSFYQVPVLYYWHDRLHHGRLGAEANGARRGVDAVLSPGA